MFHVLFSDGTIKQLPAVEKASVKDGCVSCYDANGVLLERFASLSLAAYGQNPDFEALNGMEPALPALLSIPFKRTAA